MKTGMQPRVQVQLMVRQGPKAGAPSKRQRVARLMGDAEVRADGSTLMLGDMQRSAGVELEVVDEDDPRGTFIG
jgi:hypothetical protein